MIELLNENKLVTKALQVWFTERMRKAVIDSKNKEWQEHFIQSEISVEKLAPILEINPRSLFDFFDEAQIYILPVMNDDEEFSTLVNQTLGDYHPTRILAETEGVISAFPLLEQKLATDEE